MHLDATEHGDQLVFLHAVKQGPASRSYGLQVARLGGLPAVIQRARQYLRELERRDHSARPAVPQQELELAPPRDPATDSLIEELEHLDADGLSPRDALALIFAFKERLRSRH